MKIGDLVVARDNRRDPDLALTSIKYLNENKNAGVVLRILQDTGHTNQSSYEVYWPHDGVLTWHADAGLRVIG